MTYFDPGAGSLVIQAVGEIVIGRLATLGRAKDFLGRVFSRTKDLP